MRKHVGWYLCDQPAGRRFLDTFNLIDSAEAQLLAIDRYFNEYDSGCSPDPVSETPAAANDRSFDRRRLA